MWLRTLRRRLEATGRGAPPPGLAQEILEARRAGRRVILPTSDRAASPAPARRHRRRLLAVALVAGGIAFAWLALEGRLEAGTDSGTLEFSPAVPAVGDTVLVEYRPGSKLRGAARLVLRGRSGGPVEYHEAPPQPRRIVTLEPARGRYAGRFTLGPGAVYAQLVVEDPRGETVDDNRGESWFLLAGEDGVPSRDALWAASLLVGAGRSRYDAIQRATRLYPDDPRLLAGRLAFERRIVFTRTQRDSALAFHRRRLATLTEGLDPDTLSAGRLAGFVEYAASVDDEDASARWTAILLQRFPNHPEALWYRVGPPDPGGDPVAYLDSLEALWSVAGPHTVLPPAAIEVALRAGRTRLAGDWARRELEHPGWGSDRMATIASLADRPEVVPFVVDLLREELGWIEAGGPPRPLGVTVAEHVESLRMKKRDLLVLHGRALMAMGELTAAEDNLRRATQVGWSPEAHRLLAQALLALADTARAARSLAAVAADPFESGDRGGDPSLGPRLLGRSAWQVLVQEETAALYQDLLSRARSPGRRIENVELFDGSGRGHRLDELREGRVTLLALWEPWSGEAIRDVPRLQRVGELLTAMGGALIVVTREEPSPRLEALVEEGGGSWRLYYDQDRRVAWAIETEVFPTYHLLDARRRLRFRDVSLEESVLLADVLMDEARLLGTGAEWSDSRHPDQQDRSAGREGRE